MITIEFLLRVLLIVVVSYLLGSLPTAYVISRFRNINIFEIGSGNMGGTNVARAAGFGWGVLTVLLDISKGMVALWFAQQIVAEPFSIRLITSVIASVAVISGHNWSIMASLLYQKYNPDEPFALRGGKGAATAAGTLLMLAPPEPIIAALVISIGLVVLTRYVSLAVLVFFTIAFTWLVILVLQGMRQPEYISYVVLLTMLILWRFRGNIQRLLAGNERRLGEHASH